MTKIPLYLKTDDDMPRAADGEFYLLARNGLYLCRNHRFFQSDVLCSRGPGWLGAHDMRCQLNFPKIKKTMLERIVGFFSRIYEVHGSEAVVLLAWNQKEHQYRILVPDQEAMVRESRSGYRSALDVRYTVPLALPANHLLVGDIHCHATGQAYSSFTDREDEFYRTGFHVVVGRIQEEPPGFHLKFTVDGKRFPAHFDDLFEGYRRRRTGVPREWLKKVNVKVDRPVSIGLDDFGWQRDPYVGKNY